MSESTEAPVVVGVDGRAEGLDALALAERLAGVLGARLIVVAAYPYAPLSSRILDAPTDAATARRALEGARRTLGVQDVELLTVAGSSAGRTLHEVAEDHGAGLIVVGSSHHGPAGRLVLGGVTAETLRRAPCAVAVAPRGWASGSRSIARIGVAVDGSDRDGSATAAAARLAASVEPPATVETIHVEPQGRRGTGRAAVEAAVHLEGDPADALAAHSRRLDLLVLGSRGRGRVGAVVLGSVAARLIGIARCPVLALPAGGDAHVTAVAGGQGEVVAGS
jgi:nucleotide-binding universal stress UspA family protein